MPDQLDVKAQGPCCAHLRVDHGVDSPNGGMTVTAEWWKCRDCGTLFIPSPLVDVRHRLLATVTQERDTALAKIAELERSRGTLLDQRDRARDEYESLELKNEALQQELAALRADKERLDWFERQVKGSLWEGVRYFEKLNVFGGTNPGVEGSFPTLREAIDQARATAAQEPTK